MIPFIRSLQELTAITESRNNQKNVSINEEIKTSSFDSGQRKRYLRSLEKRELDLPDLPRKIRHKWIKNKNSISRFIDDLDYNNQIQSSYDLILLERQNKRSNQDAA